MSRVTEYDFSSDRSRNTPSEVGAGSGGGGMDDISEVGELKAAISEAKTSIVQWVVGTTIAAAGIAFTIAKFVH